MAKKKRKKFFSLIFVPDQERNPRSLSMDYLKGRIILVVLIVLALHALFGFYGYVRLFQLTSRCKNLTAENDDLAKQNRKIERIAEEHMANKEILEKVLKAFGTSLGIEGEPADVLSEIERQNPQFHASLNSARTSASPETNLPLQNRLPYLTEREGGVFDPENTPTRLPVSGYLTTRFQAGGWFVGRRHLGIDIAADRGTPIRAAGSGIVIFADWTPDFGNLVIINHTNGFVTYYGHASRINVDVGDKIAKGDVIALLGSSGISSAPHLHFEIWKDGVPIDPETMVYASQRQSKTDQ